MGIRCPRNCTSVSSVFVREQGAIPRAESLFFSPRCGETLYGILGGPRAFRRFPAGVRCCVVHLYKTATTLISSRVDPQIARFGIPNASRRQPGAQTCTEPQ